MVCICSKAYIAHIHTQTVTHTYTQTPVGENIVVIYVFAVLLIILVIFRLLMELVQLVSASWAFFLEWINWVELVTYSFAIIFSWVFHNNCQCPFVWQWQIGVITVFVSWINLVVFFSKLPLTGIYMLMFARILTSFLKTIALTLLLVISFALAFYMVFHDPNIEVGHHCH